MTPGVDEREALRQRLSAYVAHEAESGRKSLQESWALTRAERVESGDCLAELIPVADQFPIRQTDALVRMTCHDFSAKFREGEPLYLGSGDQIDTGEPVVFEGYDLDRSQVFVRGDRFAGCDLTKLVAHASYCLDRRGLGLEGLLLEGLDSLYRPENAYAVDALLGSAPDTIDEGRHRAGLERAAEVGFTPAQTHALARAVGSDGVTLIQGPPGTGKTRVLAEAALLLARLRAKVFVTAFTHRAINNILLAARELSAELPLCKIGRNALNDELVRAGISITKSLDRLELPKGGCVVGGTTYVSRKFVADPRFHFLFIDEAGQMPVVHGAIAMTQARRHVVIGDPAQLPPVRLGLRRDPILAPSLFAQLERHYDSVLLDRTFRMNDELTRFVSDEFYGGRLVADGSAASRRLGVATGGPLHEVLDPDTPLVLVRLDHEGRTRRSNEEARLVCDLVEALLKQGRLPPESLAIISPFRAQVRLLRHDLGRRGLMPDKLVVDTVERMQGQEREVVVLSLVASDRDYLERQAEFYFEPGRLNVSLSRARSKCIVIASRHAFRARPRGLDELVSAARFKRLARTAPVVDLTARYCR